MRLMSCWAFWLSRLMKVLMGRCLDWRDMVRYSFSYRGLD